MNEKIKKAILWGVPLIVLITLIYAFFFAAHNGDAEFGAISDSDLTVILLLLVLILYFIFSTIILIAKKQPVFIKSFGISVVVLIVFAWVYYGYIDKIIKEQEQKEYAEYQRQYDAEIQKKNKQKDSLALLLEKEPDNYKYAEEYALLALESYVFDDFLREKYMNDLKTAIEHKTANFQTYKVLSEYQDKKEALKTLNTALSYDSAGIINLSYDDEKYLRNKIYDYTTKIEYDKNRKIEYKKQNEEKLAEINKKIEQGDSTAKIFAERVDIYRELEQYDNALADIEKVLELEPDNADALNLKVDILIQLEKYNEALSLLKQVQEKNPDNTKVLQKQIDVLLQIKRYEDALMLTDTLLKIKPADNPYLEKKPEMLVQLKRYDEAIKVYQELIDTFPERKVVYQRIIKGIIANQQQ